MALGESLFFIYDENAMQWSEYDDIADAVVFNHPKTVSFIGEKDDEMLLFFGHLVGTVKCIETIAHSLPSCITLDRCKFSVMRKTHYLLFLGCGTVGKSIPDAFIKSKLQKFVEVFSFYHGSLDRLLTYLDNDKRDFERTISHYLSIVHTCEVPMEDIFNPLPTVSFDKTSSSIAAKASHLLESCQRRERVYCGSLLSECKILSSQVPASMLQNLLYLKDHHMDRHVSSFDPGFQCPLGVRIIQVYVTKEQYSEILDISSKCPYAKIVDVVKELHGETDNVGLSKTISSTSIMSMKDDCLDTHTHTMKSSISSDALNKSSDITEGETQPVGHNIKIYTCNLPKGSPISPDLLNTLSVDSLNLHGEECGQEPVETGGAEEAVGQLEEVSHSEERASDFPTFHSNKLSVDERISDRCDLPNFHIYQKYDAEETIRADEEVANEQLIDDDMHVMHLYVQSHSDVLLVLFMEVEEAYEYSKLKTLWEMLLPQLGDIEAQVKTLAPLKNKTNQGRRTDNVKFVKYDELSGQFESNMMERKTVADCNFGDAVNLFHHQFQSSSINDVTFLAGNETHGYAKKSLFEEMFVQQRGNYKPNNGPPNSSDHLWRMDQQAGHKLKKVAKSVLI